MQYEVNSNLAIYCDSKQHSLHPQIPNVIVESDSPTKEQEISSLAIEDAATRMEGVGEHDASAPMESTPQVSQQPETDANYMPGDFCVP